MLFYMQPIDHSIDEQGRTVYEYYETTDNGNNYRLKVAEGSDLKLEIIYFEFDE
jgi:hypothetical protein